MKKNQHTDYCIHNLHGFNSFFTLLSIKYAYTYITYILRQTCMDINNFSKWFISSSKSNETKHIISVELLKLQTALKQRRCREIINRPNFMLGSSYSIITTFVSFICLVEIIKVIITSHRHHWHSKLLLEFPQSSPTFFSLVIWSSALCTMQVLILIIVIMLVVSSLWVPV